MSNRQSGVSRTGNGGLTLKEMMEAIKESEENVLAAVRRMEARVGERISDHEERLRGQETKTTRWTGVFAGFALISTLVGLVIAWHSLYP